jgi:hypothetical protein
MNPWTLALAALVASNTSFAEGPGSRIRSTPEVPLPPLATDAPKRCDTLRGEQRDRCLRESTPPPSTSKPSGPETTGMGSGAGTSPAAGTAGGATFGATAPR